jgi:hypothetical protein
MGVGASAVRAGKAFVEVFTKDSTKGGLDGIKSKMKAFGAGVAKIGGVAIAAATAATVKAIRTGGMIDDLSQRYGIHTDAIQSLSYAAELSGTSLETMVAGIRNMQKGLGNGAISDELSKLGLSMSQLAGYSPEQQFARIATALGGVTDQNKKLALTMAIFGKSGADLLPLLKAGAGGVEALASEFEALGVKMSAEAVADAAKLGDELDKLGARFDAVIVRIGTKLIPTLEKLSQRLDPAWARYARNADGDVIIGGHRPKGPINPDNPYGHTAEELGYDPNPPNPNSPMSQFLADLAARMGNMTQSAKDREQAATLQAGIDLFAGVRKEWERIGRSFDRQQEKERIRERRQITADLADVNKQIAASLDKSISFGSFDKRDLMGGVFNDVQANQLKELRESKKLLEKLLAKKGGLPVGM